MSSKQIVASPMQYNMNLRNQIFDNSFNTNSFKRKYPQIVRKSDGNIN